MSPEDLADLEFGRTYWISYGGSGISGCGDFVYCGIGPQGDYQFVPPVPGAPMICLLSCEITEAEAVSA